MPGNTERRKKKIAPIVVTVLVIAYMVPILVIGVLGVLGLLELGEGAGVIIPLALYVVLGGAVIGGVLLALRQRLREIEGGEEEDARKY